MRESGSILSAMNPHLADLVRVIARAAVEEHLREQESQHSDGTHSQEGTPTPGGR